MSRFALFLAGLLDMAEDAPEGQAGAPSDAPASGPRDAVVMALVELKRVVNEAAEAAPETAGMKRPPTRHFSIGDARDGIVWCIWHVYVTRQRFSADRPQAQRRVYQQLKTTVSPRPPMSSLACDPTGTADCQKGC